MKFANQEIKFVIAGRFSGVVPGKFAAPARVAPAWWDA